MAQAKAEVQPKTVVSGRLPDGTGYTAHEGTDPKNIRGPRVPGPSADQMKKAHESFVNAQPKSTRRDWQPVL